MAAATAEYTYVFFNQNGESSDDTDYEEPKSTPEFKPMTRVEILEIEKYTQKHNSSLLLYLLHNRQVIGYVYGTIQENNTIYISFVEIHKMYKGKRLCRPMLKQFIQESEKVVQNIPYFYLGNEGGVYSGRCYIQAFAEMRYSVYTNPMKSTPINMEELCPKNNSKNEDCDISMYFFKEPPASPSVARHPESSSRPRPRASRYRPPAASRSRTATARTRSRSARSLKQSHTKKRLLKLSIKPFLKRSLKQTKIKKAHSYSRLSAE